MRPSTIALSALAAGLLAACYSPTVSDGMQQCSDDGRCPEGLTCFKPNNRCYRAQPLCSPACTGKTPACDLTQVPPKCVGCLGDKDCPLGTVCELVSKTCRAGCSRNHPGCADDAGSCDVDAGVCRGCNSDDECAAGDVAKPRCDIATGQCQPCLPQNDNCPNGRYCAPDNGGYACLDGCRAKADCNTGMAPDCCNHKCIDTAADLENCGACGAACGMGQSCCGGACIDPMGDVSHCGACGKACKVQNATPVCAMGACGVGQCNPGFGDCNANIVDGCEADLNADPLNCRACKSACPVPAHATAACTAGVCGMGPCAAPWADCDKNAMNGCEVNTGGDLANCGACGKTCALPNANPLCIAAACAIASCKMGFSDCDKNAANGCEVNTGTDLRNCGACGNVCVLANATPACAAAACAIASCNANFADCDKAPANGCEANTQTDAKNCGACGNACAPPNAAASCNAGTCTVTGCNAGFADCDRAIANGCEVNIQTDTKNCGMCGRACAFANAVAGCAAGSCTLASCNAGFADCDKAAANGCEINTQTDNNNCGGCGVVCAGGKTCKAGVCTGNSTNYGPNHTFLGTTTDFYLSTGQGCCSVGCNGIAADDAAYFCLHFYAQPLGKTCTVASIGTQVMQTGWMLHKNSGCTSSGTDIPNTMCDGGACKLWNTNSTYSGLKGIICSCQ